LNSKSSFLSLLSAEITGVSTMLGLARTPKQGGRRWEDEVVLEMSLRYWGVTREMTLPKSIGKAKLLLQ
jgi:hypothetical protein